MGFGDFWMIPSALAFFVLAFFALAGWNLYERSGFTRFEGQIKRGVRIGAEALAWEMRQFLEAMPESIRYGKRFIRLEGRERLISEERPWWRRRSWYYVGYVDLRSPEGQLEIRMPVSTLVLTLFSLLVPFIILGSFIVSGMFNLPLIFPAIILLIIAGSLFFEHQQERKRIRSILHQAMTPRSF